MSEYTNLLKQTLEKNGQTYVDHLAELVNAETQVIGHGIKGGHEENGQKVVERLLSEMGADSIEKDQMDEAVIQKAIKEHQEGNPGHNYDGRYNVYATFKGTGKGRSLLFNGHVDTMPYGDKSLWNTDPLKATIIDGNMYGVGACDMKAGLMASICAVKLLKDAGLTVPGDVTITSVCDEEGGGNGSIQAAMRGLKADGVVVCEPSTRLVRTAHSGFIFFKVEVEGLACHSGSKWEGVSAIEKAIKIINALNELEHEWLLKYHHPYQPAPNGNVGVIEGGTAGSTVANYCCFNTCVHYMPGQTHSQMVKEYTDCINRVADADPWLCEHRPKVSIYQAGGAFEVNRDSDFVQSFCGAFEQATGEKAVMAGVTGGNDSRVWQNIAGCDTLHFGPGDLGGCHIINEHVPVADYLEAILVYAEMILDWCK